MKKIAFFAAVLAMVPALTSCALGSGNLEVRDMTPVNSFTSIDVDGVCDITITEGASCEVIVTADDNIYQYITVSESGGRLYVELDSKGISLNNFTFDVEVTMPEVNLLNISGVNDFDIRNFDISNDLTIIVDGTNDIDSSLSTMTGDLTLETDGTNSVDLYGLVVTGNADLNISGVESVKVDASGNITGSISGVSSLNFRSGTLDGFFNLDSITCNVTQD